MFEVLIDKVKVLDMHSGEESLKKVGIKKPDCCHPAVQYGSCHCPESH